MSKMSLLLITLILVVVGAPSEVQAEQKKDSSENARQRTRSTLERSGAYRSLPKSDSLRRDCGSRSPDCNSGGESGQGASPSNNPSANTGGDSKSPLPPKQQRLLDACIRQQVRAGNTADADALSFCKEKYSELQ